MRITNYSGPTGAGKSEKMKNNVIEKVGRHLYVVPRISGVEEVTADLARKRDAAGVTISLHPFTCEQRAASEHDFNQSGQARRRGGPVAKRVIDRASDYGPSSHTCFITTYATLLVIPNEIFATWTLHMDEIPAQAVISGQIYNPVMWRAYETIYDLEPLEGSKFACLHRSANCTITYNDILQDPALSQSDKNLYARVQSPTPVYVDAQTISDVGQKRCTWYSAWTLAETTAYDTVEIAVSDLTQSLMYKAHPVDYLDIPVVAASSTAEIVILYYDDGSQRCSSHYFGSEQGKNNLRLIAKHLEENGGVDFYSCNSCCVDLLGSFSIGRYVPPLIEGTNSLRELTSCAFFYSSKTQTHEDIYSEIFNMTNKSSIGLVREASAIYQFVSRSRMRDRSFTGPVAAHLYDIQQAEELREKLSSVGYLNVSIRHVELDGFVNRAAPSAGRPQLALTPDEMMHRRRAQDRERKRKQRARDK